MADVTSTSTAGQQLLTTGPNMQACDVVHAESAAHAASDMLHALAACLCNPDRVTLTAV